MAARDTFISIITSMAVAGLRFWFYRRLSVCLSVFPYDILKIDAARIIKRDKQMFHDESWKHIYFRIRRSKVQVTSHKNSAVVGLCTLVSAGV